MQKKEKGASELKNKYSDLVDQTLDFPQGAFNEVNNALLWHDIPLMDIIKQYGTPLKITYLPSISTQINKAKRLFHVAMAKEDYKGTYTYCYCTKSSHFSFVLEEALKNDIHLETSSAYDLDIVRKLHDRGEITYDTWIICNGYKRPEYIRNIVQAANAGFKNILPILDNHEELAELKKRIRQKIQIGIRIASEEEPNFGFYTSRLGMRYDDVVDYYTKKIAPDPKLQLRMLHFFINTGIRNTTYYWSELRKCLKVYCELKKVCPTLDSLNIGGGFPVQNSLSFEYDYEYITEEIIYQIKTTCKQHEVPEPNIFTEFGTFTVGESGAALYSILGQKQQNDRERWYIIDSSFMTTLPDSWAMNKRFILLPINHWDKEFQKVNLGGLTCDSLDYYNEEAHANQVFLPAPEISKAGKAANTPLYIGFFNTGAYQESVGGFGGIQHCLVPAPKHVLINKSADGSYTTRLFSKEQSAKSMLNTLGY